MTRQAWQTQSKVAARRRLTTLCSRPTTTIQQTTLATAKDSTIASLALRILSRGGLTPRRFRCTAHPPLPNLLPTQIPLPPRTHLRRVHSDSPSPFLQRSPQILESTHHQTWLVRIAIATLGEEVREQILKPIVYKLFHILSKKINFLRRFSHVINKIIEKLQYQYFPIFVSILRSVTSWISPG